MYNNKFNKSNYKTNSDPQRAYPKFYEQGPKKYDNEQSLYNPNREQPEKDEPNDLITTLLSEIKVLTNKIEELKTELHENKQILEDHKQTIQDCKQTIAEQNLQHREEIKELWTFIETKLIEIMSTKHGNNQETERKNESIVEEKPKSTHYVVFEPLADANVIQTVIGDTFHYPNHIFKFCTWNELPSDVEGNIYLIFNTTGRFADYWSNELSKRALEYSSITRVFFNF